VACLWPMQEICKVQGAFDKNMELLNPSLTLVGCTQTLTLFMYIFNLTTSSSDQQTRLWYIKVLVRILLCRMPPHFCWLCLSGTWERDFKMMYYSSFGPTFEEWSSNVIVHQGYRKVTLCFIPLSPLLSPPTPSFSGIHKVRKFYY
jgi:hypothetical protein